MDTYRYFIELAYRGTNYHGWQLQENANSIQHEVNKALGTLLGHGVLCMGCGRTDTGVHAEQFFAHFDTGETIRDTHQFLFKLNGILPSDISSKAIYPVKPTANARFDATSRTYNYKISRVKDPFDIHSSYYLFGKLNIQSMEEAAVILQEYKDFNCFCKAGTPHKTYECAVTKATWATDENQLTFTITANRFLRGMVRAIVGTMIEVGRKRIDMNGFRKIIEGKKREDSGYAVPAQGLYLKRIKYPESVFQQAEKTKGQ